MDPKELSTQELVRLCLTSRDEALWVEFVRRFRPLIFGVVKKSLGHWSTPDRAVIDDLIQETYLKLCANNYRALRDFEYEHENSLFGYLKTVASHVVQDYIRSTFSQKRGSGREEEDLDEVSATASAGAGFADIAHRNILIGEIKHCLDQHADDPHFPRDSAIFWLYYRHGLTAKAISRIPAIGLTVKGVESTLLRLTRMVRAKLSEKGGPRTVSQDDSCAKNQVEPGIVTTNPESV